MIPTEPHLPLTRHGLSRCAQRGVPQEVTALLLRYADLDLHAGAGCTSIRLGRDTAAMLLAEGARPETVSRAQRLVALLGDYGVVTVLRPHRRAGRRYRRQSATRARKAA
ncbi:hypothetical protein [Pseudoroseomonas ludipueritiae]|uniref:Uncharacterized protein n=1 Tax=Pseudoroseomonas ludipueritiae TaxID=198093 RepID=A0ABR7R2Y1_9PROT|nr:hypothetical protein [Pseudoroseomonas ludipueritiae]MBC9176109.1 hypothetical protein [Pseudoroseomonas ludipueritiae]